MERYGNSSAGVQVGREVGGEAFIPIRLLESHRQRSWWHGTAIPARAPSSPFFGRVIAIQDENGHVVCGVRHVRWVTVQHVSALEVPGLGGKGSIRRQNAPWYSRSGTAVKQGCPATSASQIQRYSLKQLRQGLSLVQLIGRFTTRGGAAPIK